MSPNPKDVFYQSFQGATGAPVITLRLKELAPQNILFMLGQLDTFHLFSDWLKDLAFLNIEERRRERRRRRKDRKNFLGILRLLLVIRKK